MRYRIALLAGALTIPAIALGNAAMGYALEIFEFRIWIVYVVSTVVLEAWVVGRSLGHSWPKSIALSFAFTPLPHFAARLVYALLCSMRW